MTDPYGIFLFFIPPPLLLFSYLQHLTITNHYMILFAHKISYFLSLATLTALQQREWISQLTSNKSPLYLEIDHLFSYQ